MSVRVRVVVTVEISDIVLVWPWAELNVFIVGAAKEVPSARGTAVTVCQVLVQRPPWGSAKDTLITDY